MYAGKSRIMRFEKKIRKGVKREWKWGEKEIEKVSEYKYLGFVFQRNGKAEAHVKDRVRKAGGAMREVWEIGKR